MKMIQLLLYFAYCLHLDSLKKLAVPLIGIETLELFPIQNQTKSIVGLEMQHAGEEIWSECDYKISGEIELFSKQSYY